MALLLVIFGTLHLRPDALQAVVHPYHVHPQPHDPQIFIRSTLGRGFNDGVPGYASLLLAPLALLLPGPRRGRVAGPSPLPRAGEGTKAYRGFSRG